MSELFDTHCHLDHSEFDSDREDVIARARAAGISRFISVGASRGLDSARSAIELSERYPFIWASVGVHPHDVAQEIDQDLLETLATHPRVVAIGETGLDFYRDWSPRHAQEDSFLYHIDLAKRTKKPLIIHSREAGETCYTMLARAGAEEIGGVFHCFSETAEFAERLRTLGFLVSIPGSLTFKKSDALRHIVRDIPIEQIMVETDAPYLAPEPFRGKRCESTYMVKTAEMIAQIKGISFEELCEVTTANALRLFKIPSNV